MTNFPVKTFATTALKKGVVLGAMASSHPVNEVASIEKIRLGSGRFIVTDQPFQNQQAAVHSWKEKLRNSLTHRVELSAVSKIPAHLSIKEGNDLGLSTIDYEAITSNWQATNDRRVDLIIKEEDGDLSGEEEEELNHLQALAEVRIKANRGSSPTPSTSKLDEWEAYLKSEGWLPEDA